MPRDRRSRTLSQNSANPTQEALAELRRTSRRLEELQDDIDAALFERDRAIVAAATAGLTRRRIAGVVGLSAARVQQICNAAGNGGGGPRT